MIVTIGRKWAAFQFPPSCHSERSEVPISTRRLCCNRHEESAFLVTNKQIPRRCAPRNDKGGYDGESDDVMPMDVFDFGVGPYDRGEAGSRRVAGWGDQHFEQRDESQAFDCAECDRIAGAAGSWPLLRQRQGGHHCQPDHGSAQLTGRPICPARAEDQSSATAVSPVGAAGGDDCQ
jgi:hypothetical protein